MAALVCRRLRPRERYVVVMHYAENLTLAEIGAVLGLSESRVCQLHEKALARLRRRAS
jgi:RNA polymerase sigma factor for flagellar operon FliA